MNQMPVLNATEIAAAADAVLERSAYRRLDSSQRLLSPETTARIYEDVYGVVWLSVFESVAALLRGWHEQQAAFVELLTQHLASEDAKAWDGYLVLLSGDAHHREQAADIEEIRRDTRRVRKLVATGARIRTLRDVEDVLQPLLPLEVGGTIVPSSPFETLPEVLETQGIPRELTRQLATAFESQQPLMRVIQRWGEDT